MDLPTQLGDFRVEAVLGQGGSGIVYDARWGPRRVALKVLHPGLAGTGRERSQFLAEAEKLQSITHPSVVKVFAVGTLPDGRPYLAMERLEGETLGAVIARGPMSLTRALDMFGELAAAVEALHKQGLVHRDLKPENVFVVGGVHSVLLDFGIAKDLAAPASTMTQEGSVRGTPAYMAPERFFGQPAGIPTDVYELALILYAMLAGRLPWDELADPEARLSPRPLVDLAAVPEALDVEIRRALSTRAQNRPANAGALLGAVQVAASGSATQPGPSETARLRPAGESAPTPPPEQSTPLAWAPTLAAPGTTARPRRTRTLALGIAAFVIAGGGVAAWQLRQRRPQTADLRPQALDTGSATATKHEVPNDPNDPWAAHDTPDTRKALPLVEPVATLETYRAESAAAIARMPADTTFIVAAQLTELHKQSQIEDMLQKLGKHPKVALMTGVLPPCVKALATDAEWFVFGAHAIQKAEYGALVLRGRWRRADVESCFEDAVKTHTAHDGKKLYRIGDFGWLDFIDDHTAYIALRTDLDAEKVHLMSRRGAGPASHTRDLYARLPADRAFVFIADGAGGDDWKELGLTLPRGSDVYGWARVDPAKLELDLAADAHDVAGAKAAEAAIKPQIDELFKTASESAVGKLEVVRDKTVVHLRGTMTALMLGIVSAALTM